MQIIFFTLVAFCSLLVAALFEQFHISPLLLAAFVMVMCLQLLFQGFNKWFVYSIVAVSMLLASQSSKAQTIAGEPAYASMQRAIGGIIQSVALSRGVSANDPKTYATLYGMGRAAIATTATGAVGTGLLVAAGAVTAPAWGTVLAQAAVIGAATYAISLTWDNTKQWLFSQEGVKEPPVVVAASGVVCISTSEAGGDCQCSGMSGAKGTSTLVNRFNGMFTFTMNCTRAQLNSWPPAATDSMANAAARLKPEELSQRVHPEAIAGVINETWKKAAAQPGYAGIPYEVTKPVTESEVKSWADANPGAYPPVSALLAPVTNTSTGLVPSITTSEREPLQLATAAPGSPAAAVAVPATTASSASAGPGTETTPTTLGSDPGVGFDKQTTPTAQSIFQPFLSLVQPFIDFQVNAPAGACPKPVFDVFGKQIALTTHCDLFEQLRPVISAVMTATFMVMAILIVFSA